VDTDSDNDLSHHHRRRVVPRRIDEMRDLVINISQSNMKACMQTLKPLFDIFVLHVSRRNLAINNLNAALDMFLSKDTKPDVYAPDAKRMVDLRWKGS
jgi:hypothetical protein